MHQMTDEHILQQAIDDARACALAMMDNAAFIETELPDVAMPPALESRAREVCAELVGTKHDVFSELSELEEMRADGQVADSVVRARFERIIDWLGSPLEPMHELVRAIEVLTQGGLAWTLVAESATNIYEAFTRARDSAQRLWGGER